MGDGCLLQPSGVGKAVTYARVSCEVGAVCRRRTLIKAATSGLGLYPNVRHASSTRWRVASETSRLFERHFETVATDTPTWFAMSRMLTDDSIDGRNVPRGHRGIKLFRRELLRPPVLDLG